MAQIGTRCLYWVGDLSAVELMNPEDSTLATKGLEAGGITLEGIFLQHQWSWIQASVKQGKEQKPSWWTCGYSLTKAKLHDLWQSIEKLIGVSFGNTTTYGMLDIDAGSPYCHANGIRQIQGALENLGIVRTILIRSSHSGGLHLYLPLPEAVNTFNLAVALDTVLQDEGFTVAAGTLEIFPNIKQYRPPGSEQPSSYRAHRLPLQPGTGSYLLDDMLNPIGDSLDIFFQHWSMASSHQDIESLSASLVTMRQRFDENRKATRNHQKLFKTFRDAQKAQKTSPDEGIDWTGHGQTNEILGKLAWYGRVCCHLAGQALVDYIVTRAQNSPGYHRYCKHQKDIKKRAKDWARCAERHHQELESSSQQRQQTKVAKPNQNQVKAEATLQRLLQGIETLQQENRLPTAITKRMLALNHETGISSATLYEEPYKHYWHPSCSGVVEPGVVEPSESKEVEPVPPVTETDVHANEAATPSFSNQTPEPLPNKGLEKFYTLSLMKLCPQSLGAKWGLLDPNITRYQGLQPHTGPENEKICPGEGWTPPLGHTGRRGLPSLGVSTPLARIGLPSHPDLGTPGAGSSHPIHPWMAIEDIPWAAAPSAEALAEVPLRLIAALTKGLHSSGSSCPGDQRAWHSALALWGWLTPLCDPKGSVGKVRRLLWPLVRLNFLQGIVSVALDGLLAPGWASAVMGLVQDAGGPLGSGAADSLIPLVPSLELLLKGGADIPAVGLGYSLHTMFPVQIWAGVGDVGDGALTTP